MPFWELDGKIVMEGDDVVECDECPCCEGCVYCAPFCTMKATLVNVNTACDGAINSALTGAVVFLPLSDPGSLVPNRACRWELRFDGDGDVLVDLSVEYLGLGLPMTVRLNIFEGGVTCGTALFTPTGTFCADLKDGVTVGGSGSTEILLEQA